MTYRVPSMGEVRAVPWNGLTVASTFSGAGGSCLGYRMAGFRVVWANEFTEGSARIYRLNHDAVLDTRDIRDVRPEEILEATGLAEVDVLDGSPPCDSFSTAGRRDKGWGKEKAYAKGIRQRTDDLFLAYVRLLDGLQPRAFVAENVKGMIMGKARGYFKEVMRGLAGCGYRVRAKVLDAQWLGVPQHRERVIFLGIRRDLGLEPRFPPPLDHRPTTRDAIPHAVGQVVGNVAFEKKWGGPDRPHVTICAAGSRTSGQIEVECAPGVRDRREMTIAECKAICSFPEDFAMEGPHADQWRALGMSVPPLMMRAVASTLRDQLLGV